MEAFGIDVVKYPFHITLDHLLCVDVESGQIGFKILFTSALRRAWEQPMIGNQKMCQYGLRSIYSADFQCLCDRNQFLASFAQIQVHKRSGGGPKSAN